MSLLLLSLLGCFTPKETGPTSMVGVVVDADGQPLAGVQVRSVEARDVTDASGRFGVSYKEPGQWVAFTHQGVHFRRWYRPDDPGEVRIQVPALAPTTLACTLPERCRAEATWTLGPGFTAELAAPCDPDAPTPLEAVPAGEPSEVTCRVSTIAPEQPARGTLGDDGLVIGPPLPTLTVALGTLDRNLPQDCQVFVDGLAAQRVRDGTYRAPADEDTVVEAVCDGIPAVPRRVRVVEDLRLDFQWDADAPVVDLQAFAPWADRLTFARVGPGRRWLLTRPAAGDGTFVLPPLDPGVYALGAGVPEQVVRDYPASDAHPAGQVILHPWHPEGDGEEPAELAFLGVLVVERPIDSARIPVVGQVP